MKLYVWNLLNMPIFCGNFYGTSMMCITANSVQETIDYMRKEIENHYTHDLERWFQNIQGYYKLMFLDKYKWENPECELHPLFLKATKECYDDRGYILPGKDNLEKWKIYNSTYLDWNNKIFWELSKTPTEHFVAPLVYESPGVILYSNASD